MEQRIIMKRIDQILSHPVFREQFALLQEAEKDRIFCRHTMEHFLDVARLMYIYNLEDQAGFSKEMIYAAGLLHDIGRYEQMEKGTAETPLFSRYLYRADKQSRNCLYCPARNACNWPEEKMNLTICY